MQTNINKQMIDVIAKNESISENVLRQSIEEGTVVVPQNIFQAFLDQVIF